MVVLWCRKPALNCEDRCIIRSSSKPCACTDGLSQLGKKLKIEDKTAPVNPEFHETGTHGGKVSGILFQGYF